MEDDEYQIQTGTTVTYTVSCGDDEQAYNRPIKLEDLDEIATRNNLKKISAYVPGTDDKIKKGQFTEGAGYAGNVEIRPYMAPKTL